MATVPRLERKIQSTAIPNVRMDPSAPIESFGGGQPLKEVGAAANNLLDNEATRINAEETANAKKSAEFFKVEKDKADQVAVQDFDLKLSEAHTDIENKIKSLQGKDAIHASDIANDEWKKSTEELKKSLYNDDQRMAADKIIAARQGMIYKTAQDHTSSEIEKYDDNETKSYVETVRSESVNNAMNEQRIGLSIFQQKMALEKYGARKGLTGSDALKSEIANAVSDTHVGVIEKRISLGDINAARSYYNAHKDEIVAKDSVKFPEYIDAQEKRLKALKDDAKKKQYEDNYRQALLDSFAGKLTLTELQRKYRNDEIDDSAYKGMAHIVADPAFSFMNPKGQTDPSTFNEIRQAQLSGSKSQREILDMIQKGQSEGKIVNRFEGGDDGAYLIRLTKENVMPSPNDRRTDAGAQAVRDFGQRYFTDHEGFLARHLQKDDEKKATQSKQAEDMVSDFLRRVDTEHATGDRIDEIAKEVQGEHIKRDHPELSRLDDVPHIVLGIDGKVQHVLNPDQNTKLKPRYRITPVKSSPAADKPKEKKK